MFSFRNFEAKISLDLDLTGIDYSMVDKLKYTV
jgi:hypothetical protein